MKFISTLELKLRSRIHHPSDQKLSVYCGPVIVEVGGYCPVAWHVSDFGEMAGSTIAVRRDPIEQGYRRGVKV